MSDDRSWLTDEYPELRDGPPWVMEDMILATRALPEAMLDGDRTAATAIGELVAGAAVRGEPIVVVGCGTSEHAAMAVAALLAEAHPTARVESRQALDAAVHPRDGGVCIGVSHDGGTKATLLAMEAARASGATVAVITSQAASLTAAAADEVYVTPVHDVSWCHTIAYTSAILAAIAIAHEGATGLHPAQQFDALLALRPQLAEAAQSVSRGRRIITTGLGTDHIAARELALKIEEGARIPATAHHLETLLHGHLAGCDADSTAVVRFAFDPNPSPLWRSRGPEADAALAAIGIPTIVLGEPTRSAAPALFASAITLQLFTLELAHAAGTNPDLIRREQKPYRDAAEAAGN